MSGGSFGIKKPKNIYNSSSLNNKQLTSNLLENYKNIDFSDTTIFEVKTEFKQVDSKEEIKKEAKKPTEEEKSTGAVIWDYARTAIGGVVEGFLGVGEGVVDAHLYGTGLTIKGLTMGNYGDGLAYDAVAYDVSGKVENAINYGVDEDIKNSGWSNTPRVIGHGLGYQALSKVPFVGVALAAQGGAGKEAEKSMNKQMAETGTINEWTVFYRSFLGSIEGFIGSKLSKAADKYKAVGSQGIVSGVKNLSKQGFGAFVKNQGLVFKSAAQNSLKDPRIWADLTGITFKKFESILAGTYSKTDLALDLLGIPLSTKFWDGVGEAGLGFVEMFK